MSGLGRPFFNFYSSGVINQAIFRDESFGKTGPKPAPKLFFKKKNHRLKPLNSKNMNQVKSGHKDKQQLKVKEATEEPIQRTQRIHTENYSVSQGSNSRVVDQPFFNEETPKNKREKSRESLYGKIKAKISQKRTASFTPSRVGGCPNYSSEVQQSQSLNPNANNVFPVRSRLPNLKSRTGPNSPLKSRSRPVESVGGVQMHLDRTEPTHRALPGYQAMLRHRQDSKTRPVDRASPPKPGSPTWDSLVSSVLGRKKAQLARIDQLYQGIPPEDWRYKEKILQEIEPPLGHKEKTRSILRGKRHSAQGSERPSLRSSQERSLPGPRYQRLPAITPKKDR